MYKVFVVDDEIAIREGIRNSRIWDGGMLTLVKREMAKLLIP